MERERERERERVIFAHNLAHPRNSLLRKVSSEIINRCCAKISLEEIFSGDVEGSMVCLQDSIQCGVAWKNIYQTTKAAIEANVADTKRHWDFDIASIFAQIDAFVQRCRDLLEVCEGQIQFARKVKGGKMPLPAFGGTKGPEISKSLLDNEVSFSKHIQRLRDLDYDILDVKATRWHDVSSEI